MHLHLIGYFSITTVPKPVAALSRIASHPEIRRQFEKELASSAETAFSLLIACLNFGELKNQMGSPERYDHISLVDLSKKQKIEKKREMNTQEFVKEEKFDSNSKNTKLSIEERKQRFIKSFYIKKDYVCLERINRRLVNNLDGLELHIEHTYSEPKKLMRGKGRNRIPPGILRHGIIDPIPNHFKIMKK
ncbi:hypothetical protein IEQ34_020542 [Dendrobium chrysotoxum]|uniref:Uncharacterized protein n=1 Tax=Dendrobium chrysotoxum TaxID=161865 RepID=A0AAV7FKK0_DENCH|nr:hypothetical protein IEQ34_020542 [Dendrobium chrysotoxum]